MDFTDILSNIFVSTKNKRETVTPIDIKKEIVSIKKEIKQVQKIKQEKEKDYTHKYSISESAHKSNKKSYDKSYDHSYDKSYDHSYERSYKSSKQSNTETESKQQSESEYRKKSESQKKSYKSVSYESQSESESESESESQKKSYKSESEKVVSKIQKYNFRKLILKASEFYKRNIFIINSDETSNVKILGELLEKLNNMKDVFEIYDKNMSIYTFTENKKNYKMILLENPYLNFEFNFKNTLKNVKFIDTKKHIVIIDFNLISDLDKILDENLLEQNVHLIVLFNSYTLSPALIDLYKFDKNALIINKKGTLKSIQKIFYSKVIKHIVKDQLLDKDTYTELITDEDLDVKNIIIKNGELRYN